MEGPIILWDVMVKVMVVTSSCEVEGQLKLLEHSPARKMDRQVIGPIMIISSRG